jgi:putative flippase GtrA
MYLFFGGLSFALSMFLYFIFTYLFKLDILIANLISWFIVVAFCFVTNRKYVFKNKSENLLKQLVSFYIARIGTLLIEELILFVFISCLNFNDILIKIIAQIVVIVSNYIFSKIFIFKNK